MSEREGRVCCKPELRGPFTLCDLFPDTTWHTRDGTLPANTNRHSAYNCRTPLATHLTARARHGVCCSDRMRQWTWLVVMLRLEVELAGCASSNTERSGGGPSGSGGETGSGDCSIHPSCDDDFTGTWRFVTRCPESYVVLSDTAPESCYRSEVRDVLDGTLTIDAAGGLTLEATAIQTVSTVWTAACREVTGSEQTAEFCSAREEKLREFNPTTRCQFDGSDCTCVSSSEEPATIAATVVSESLCAHGDELSFEESIPQTLPGGTPVPSRIVVHRLSRVR